MSEIWISKLNLRFGLNWKVFDSELEIQLVNSRVLNISFEPEFGNPIIEIQVSKFGFLSNCWFYSLVPAVKPGVLNLFLNSKIWFSNSDFQNSFSIPNWYLKPRKIHFKSKKGHSLFYFNKNSSNRVFFIRYWNSSFSSNSNYETTCSRPFFLVSRMGHVMELSDWTCYHTIKKCIISCYFTNFWARIIFTYFFCPVEWDMSWNYRIEPAIIQ